MNEKPPIGEMRIVLRSNINLDRAGVELNKANAKQSSKMKPVDLEKENLDVIAELDLTKDLKLNLRKSRVTKNSHTNTAKHTKKQKSTEDSDIIILDSDTESEATSKPLFGVCKRSQPNVSSDSDADVLAKVESDELQNEIQLTKGTKRKTSENLKETQIEDLDALSTLPIKKKKTRQQSSPNAKESKIASSNSNLSATSSQNDACLVDSHIKSSLRIESVTNAIPEKKAKCGLCGNPNTSSLIKTSCCNNFICNDLEKFEIFGYSRDSCFRNHHR